MGTGVSQLPRDMPWNILVEHEDASATSFLAGALFVRGFVELQRTRDKEWSNESSKV